jgi:hypothetical protein
MIDYGILISKTEAFPFPGTDKGSTIVFLGFDKKGKEICFASVLLVG